MIRKRRSNQRKSRLRGPPSHFATQLRNFFIGLLLVIFQLGFLAALAFGGYWLLIRVPAGEVRLAGDFEVLQSKDVRKVMAEDLQHGYFMMDLAAMRDAVAELPWVQRARVQRIWPSGVIVWIQERYPQAVWNDRYYLDRDGKLLPLVDEAINLPQIAGSDDSRAPYVLQHYRRFEDILSNSWSKGLASAEMDLACCWRLQLVCGPTLIASLKYPYRELQNFNVFYSFYDRSDQQFLARADLRYTNGLAVVWSNVPTHKNCDGNEQISPAETIL